MKAEHMLVRLMLVIFLPMNILILLILALPQLRLLLPGSDSEEGIDQMLKWRQ